MLAFSMRMVLRSLVRRFRRSAVTFLGVAFAVAVLVVLASIMVGVGDAMIQNAVAIHTGHVYAVFSPGVPRPAGPDARLSGVPGLRTALWRKRREGMLTHGGRRTSMTVYAVQPGRERAGSVVPGKVVRGDYLASAGSMVLGAAAAEALGVDVGDEVELAAAGAPRQRFRVAGIFHTRMESLDRRTAYVRFEDVAGPADELAVLLNSPASAEAVAEALRRSFPGAVVTPWREALPELTQLIGLNEVSMDIVLVLALLILAFGISNTVFISVSERTREFGVLRAMGMRPGRITMLVLAETLVLVCSAALVGMAIGAGVSAAWARTGLDLGAWTSANRHFIASGVVYPRATGRGLALPVIVALACGALAGALPAARAGRIDVVQALRSL